MKEILKGFIQSGIELLFCFSLLSILVFVFVAYVIPVDRMCGVDVHQLHLMVLIGSSLFMAAPAIGDIVRDCLRDDRRVEETDNEKQRVTKEAGHEKTLWQVPIPIVLTEIALYAINETCDISISLEKYLIISGAIALFLFFWMALRRRVLYGAFSQGLTKRQKLCLVGTTIALCAGLTVLIVPRAADRIRTYSMYWEGSPQTPYTFEYPVNDTRVLIVENMDGGHAAPYYFKYFDLLPGNVLSEFAEEGWKIRIDSNYLAEYSWQKNGKRYGPLTYATTDRQGKTIITHSCIPAIFEIGRYCYNSIADKEKVEKLYAAEAGNISPGNVEGELYSGESFTDPEEFFAASFQKYVLAKGNNALGAQLAQKIPMTTAYLEELFDRKSVCSVHTGTQ